MIKILHVVSSLNGGGVENMLYNYYLHIDRNIVQFDFIVHGDSIGILETKFQSLGSTIFHVTPKKQSFIKNIREINSIIKCRDYAIVHCHQNFSSFSTLLLALIYNVPVRISHAHGCKNVQSIKVKIKNSFLRFLNKLGANYFFACGFEAAKWLHGGKWLQNDTNKVMNNAIDINQFTYDVNIRKEYRKELNIEDKIVLLHVGRFSDEKNHLFLIDVIQKLLHESDKYMLLFVGEGNMEDTVRKRVQQKGVSKSVLFLGVRSDVANLMNAADIFLLPSKHEGFGITLIEAQATGLPVLTSDKVPRETRVTDLIQYISIDNIEIWVEKILDTKTTSRKSRKVEVEVAGYSIETQAIQYQEWLEQLCKTNIIQQEKKYDDLYS